MFERKENITQCVRSAFHLSSHRVEQWKIIMVLQHSMVFSIKKYVY